MSKDISELRDMANILRRDVLKMTTAAGSGHPTSCLSCAEIMSVLFFSEMAYDTKNPSNPDNDEFVLSKGHAAPVLYASLFRAGCIKEDLNTLRRINSPLEGHPMPGSLKWVKAATGSLGQGLSVGVGMALAAKMRKRQYRTYVLMGDSEAAEGSVYEAANSASYYKLNNLCAIIDVNHLGQSGETMFAHNTGKYEEIFTGLGWSVSVIDGHNISRIKKALVSARKSAGPALIVAKTLKGKGVSFMENKEGFHGKALPEDKLGAALREIPDAKMPEITINMPGKIDVKNSGKKGIKFTEYRKGESVATRKGYGNALANLANADENVIAMDAEVSNSTFSEEVRKVLPRQFIEAYIAEQNMAGMALGLSAKGFRPFASTFAAFLSRAHDQIRMASLSSANITFCGSHSGVSIGEDGASQMGLEDIAMFRSMLNTVILYPSDAVSAEKLVKLAYDTEGIKYIRTTRGSTPVIYDNHEEFALGGFKVLKQSPKDSVVLAGAGITLHEALKAHEELKKQGTSSAVVDMYCIKPFDASKFREFANKHGNKIIISEDHYKAGGIGEMVSSALCNSGIEIKSLSVNKLPHSGRPDELLAASQINWKSIAKAVNN